MTTREQNTFIAQTGPGTPMRSLVRRYWIPALLSSEIAEPDCPPVRLKLLGERLIAFRNSLVGFRAVGADRKRLLARKSSSPPMTASNAAM
jgi:hypothetical protein